MMHILTLRPVWLAAAFTLAALQPGPSHADDTEAEAVALLEAGRQPALRAGQVTLREVAEALAWQTREQLLTTLRRNHAPEPEIEYHLDRLKHLPKTTVSNVQLRFDNELQEVCWLFEPVDSLSYRQDRRQADRASSLAVTIHHGQAEQATLGVGPPQELPVEQAVWLGQAQDQWLHAHAKGELDLSVMARDAATVTLRLQSRKQANWWWEVRLDAERPQRILEIAGHDGGHVSPRLQIDYDPLDALDYPTQVVHEIFGRLPDGEPRASYRTTTQRVTATLNPDLTAADFPIVPVPAGAEVMDQRFDPVLVYRQPDQPLTDEDLRELHEQQEQRRQPGGGLLVPPVAEPERPPVVRLPWQPALIALGLMLGGWGAVRVGRWCWWE